MPNTDGNQKIYTLTVYLAAPGTPIYKEGRQEATSQAGHMYYAVSDGDDIYGYGFSPAKPGEASGPGHVVKDEQNSYRNPAYARTLQIKKEQYDKLREYGEAGLAQKETYFNLNYHGVRNSCVDFVWGALNHAELHARVPLLNIRRTGYDGEVKVMQNKEALRQIQPPFPNSVYNKESEHPLPRRTLMQRFFTEADMQQKSSEHASLPADFAPALQVGTDMRQPEHPGHIAYSQALKAVHSMEFRHGIAAGPQSEQLAAQLALVAAEAWQGITHVEMQDGQIHAIERYYAFDEGKRVSIAAADAVSMSVEQASARWLAVRSPHYQHHAARLERSPEQIEALQMLNKVDREMFSAMRGQLPASIPDETVAHAMVQAKKSGIDDASQLDKVVLHGERLFVLGKTPGFRAAVDANGEAPALAESVQQVQAVNQERQQQLAMQQEQQQIQGRPMAMG